MRHVASNRLRKDEEGRVLGVLPQAFRIRGDSEDHLSAAWVEHANCATMAENADATILAFKAKRVVRNSHRFAVGNIGRIKEACLNFGQRVRVSHEPVPGFWAHASVRQFNSESDELLDLLAQDAWAELFSP